MVGCGHYMLGIQSRVLQDLGIRSLSVRTALGFSDAGEVLEAVRSSAEARSEQWDVDTTMRRLAGISEMLSFTEQARMDAMLKHVLVDTAVSESDRYRALAFIDSVHLPRTRVRELCESRSPIMRTYGLSRMRRILVSDGRTAWNGFLHELWNDALAEGRDDILIQIVGDVLADRNREFIREHKDDLSHLASAENEDPRKVFRKALSLIRED